MDYRVIFTRMTQDERGNGIGKLVRRYNDNEEALAILTSADHIRTHNPHTKTRIFRKGS